MKSVAALFEKENGFFAFRTVRQMAFVDFTSVPSANLSMRKYQNYMFPHIPHSKPLMIDYDKDERSKRDKQFEKQM